MNIRNNDYNQGDMILGVEGNKEIIRIRKNNRFTDTLTVGPTGSAKLAKVILPQLDRDIGTKEFGVVVLGPNKSLTDSAFNMANRHGRTDVVYFNPTHNDSPYFNPLAGEKEEVISYAVSVYDAKVIMNKSEPNSYFSLQGEMLLRRSLEVLKSIEKDEEYKELLYGDEATLIDLDKLINNQDFIGRKMVTAYADIERESLSEQEEANAIASWFLSDYFTGSELSNKQMSTKTYEHTETFREEVRKLVENEFLGVKLNPPKGENHKVDFEKILKEGQILLLTTNQKELRSEGLTLGQMLIHKLQDAVLRRPGDIDSRGSIMVYIDEYHLYANEHWTDVLGHSSSYRVAFHLSTQSVSQIGSEFYHLEYYSKHSIRNVLLFPDSDNYDIDWFVKKVADKGLVPCDIKDMRFGQFSYVIEDENYRPLHGIVNSLN